jgi:hypothetical protein
MPDEKKREMTEYLILGGTGPNKWLQLARVEAYGTRDALRRFTDEHPHNEVGPSFVAVPSRSWRPVVIRAVTTRRLVFEEPSEQLTVEQALAD